MFTKMKTKMQNMNWKDWLQTGLWSSVLAFLMIFVIAAATMTKSTTSAVTVKAQVIALSKLSTDKNIDAFNERVQAAKPANIGNAIDTSTSKIDDPKYIKDGLESLITEDDAAGTKYVAGVSTTAKWTTPAHTIYTTTPIAKYDNTLAAFGALFTVAIFASLAVTVGVKYDERKRGNN